MQAGVADASEWIRSKLGGAAECFLGAYGRVQQKLRRTGLAACKTLEMPRVFLAFSVKRVQEQQQARQDELRSINIIKRVLLITGNGGVFNNVST